MLLSLYYDSKCEIMDNLTEKLIEAVRERPFLYDMRHNDYKNNFKKSVAWTEIADEIGGESGEAMKEKWKNLRDTFKKHKKSLHTSSGQAAKKLKNWVWAAHMHFLDASITLRSTEGSPLNPNVEASSSTQQPNIQASTSTATQLTTTPNIDAHTDCTEKRTHLEEIGNSRRRRRNKDASDKIIDFLKSKSSKKNERIEDKLDKIDYLFLNYAETFKRLTLRRQAILKLDMAKLFTEAELADMDNINTTPTNAASNYNAALTPTYSIISDYSDPGQIINVTTNERIINLSTPLDIDNIVSGDNSGQIVNLSTPNFDATS